MHIIVPMQLLGYVYSDIYNIYTVNTDDRLPVADLIFCVWLPDLTCTFWIIVISQNFYLAVSKDLGSTKVTKPLDNYY